MRKTPMDQFKKLSERIILMNLDKKLKKWHEILVPDGNYKKLKIRNVKDCWTMANYIRKKRRVEDHKLIIFGELYIVPMQAVSDIRNAERISFEDFYNSDEYHYGKDFVKRELSPVPLRPSGKSWGAHVLYVEGDMAIDPVLGKVCKFADYSQLVFNEDVPYEVCGKWAYTKH